MKNEVQQSNIDVDFGDGFVFEQSINDIQDIEITARGVTKLSPEQQSLMQTELGIAIENKDIDSVRQALSSGAKPKGSIGVRRISDIVISHFDENIANLLISEGLKLQYSSKLMSLAIDQDRGDLLHWIAKNDSNQNNMENGLISQREWNGLLYHAMSKRKEKSVEYMIRNGRDGTDGSFVCGVSHDKINVYELGRIFDQGVKNNNLVLLDLLISNNKTTAEGMIKEWTSLYINCDTSHINTFAYANPFRPWLSLFGPNISYQHCINIQNFLIEYPQHKKIWEQALSFDINKSRHTRSIKLDPLFRGDIVNPIIFSTPKVSNFLNYLVLSGSPALSKISLSKKGRASIQNTLFDTNNFAFFITNTSSGVLKDVINKNKEFFSSWRDQKGNGLAHYMLSDNPNGMSCDFLYSFDKDLLELENNDGKDPTIILNPSLQASISKKLIKKNMNDLKIGLIHNRTKSAKRKI